MAEFARHAALGWMREHAGPDGTVVVDRGVLRQAGIPERFVSRLSSRLHDMAKRGHIVIERKERVGRDIKYVVRLLRARSGPAEERPVAVPAPEPREGRFDIVLRLAGREGRIAVEELFLLVGGASGGVRGPGSEGNLKEALELYREQGMQLVENALKMQRTVERLEGELSEVRRLQEEVAGLQLRVDALSRVVEGLASSRSRVGEKPKEIPRIFAEDVG